MLKNGCELCSSMPACRCPQGSRSGARGGSCPLQLLTNVRILWCRWCGKYALIGPAVIVVPASGMTNNPGHPSADKNSSAFSRVGKRPSSR
jgi:hypothetical protein